MPVKQLLPILFIFTIISCKNEVKKTTHFGNEYKSILSKTSFLHSERLIESLDLDEFGLQSPAAVLFLGEYNDSIDAVKRYRELANSISAMHILNTKKYHYQGKHSNYCLISRDTSELNSNRFRTIQLFRMRPSNLELDSLVNEKRLSAIYHVYQTDELEKGLYLVHPQKLYVQARQFTRILYFAQNSQQSKSFTVDDYKYLNSIQTNSYNLFAFVNPFSGAMFDTTIARGKLVLTDKQLNIINSIEFRHPYSNLLEIHQQNGGWVASLEYHLSCDICEQEFCFYDVEFDERLNVKCLTIVRKPESMKNMESFLRNPL